MELKMNKIYKLKNEQIFLKVGEILTYKGNNEFICSDGLSVYLNEDMVTPLKNIDYETRQIMCEKIMQKAMVNDTLFFNLIELTSKINLYE